MQYFVLTVLVALSLASPAFSQAAKSNDILKRLLDLPAPAPGEPTTNANSTDQQRPDEFYRWKNIPPDDAPLEDLLEYWKGQRYEPSTILFRKEMSPKTAERLLDHFRDNPSLIYEYLGAMPTDERTAGSIRELHKLLSSGPEDYPGSQLREWLTNNTPDGIGPLTKLVRKIRDNNEYVSNEFQVALKSLAKLDWDAARPHVERLEFDASNPHSQILAYWVRYVRAIDAKETSDIDTYRRKLQKVVEDRSARWSARDLAMDALVDGGDWEGRDEWYTSLFEDETLLAIQENGYTGMTTMMNAAASTEEWMERFLRLIKSNNMAIRSTAARNLVDIYRDEKVIIEALLPWVVDRNWAKESRSAERGRIIKALGDHDLPAAVPALITVLSNEPDQRMVAANAIEKKKDPRAGPVLRSIISEEAGEVRDAIIAALVASGAMSPDEQMTNVEAYAVMSSTEAGRLAMEMDTYADYDDPDDSEGSAGREKKKSPIPIEVSIGKALAAADEPDEGLAVRAIEREKVLRKKSPEVAAQLAQIIAGWKGRPVFLELLRQVRAGEANVDTILNLLTDRASIRAKLPNEVANLRASSGLLRGLGACIAEDEGEFLSITGTGDAESRIAMLSCARLLRAKLPVNEIARMLDNANGLIKLAAERYLESEDSVEARRFVLARHPGEALILGARTAFIPEPKNADNNSAALTALFQTVNRESHVTQTPHLRKMESDLQTEIKENKNLSAIFARLPEAASGQQIVRVYKDRINYTFHDDTARFWSRDLSEKEFKAFESFIRANNIDAMPASVGACDHGCPSGEFVMFGRDGGRRNFFSGYRLKEAFAGLDAHFEGFKTKDDLKLNYHLALKIKGLEVILADSKFPVHAVWKNEADLRFLVSDLELAESIEKDLAEKTRLENEVEIDDENEEEATKQRSERYERQEKRRIEASGKELSWRTLENGKVGAFVGQPKEVNLLPALSQIPRRYRGVSVAELSEINLADGVVYANRYEGGLFRMQESGEPIRIKEGIYVGPVVSADKRWVAVTKFTEGKPSVVTRVNLQNGQEFVVGIPPAEIVYPVALVPTHNRILIYRGPRRPGTSRSMGIDFAEEESDEAEELPAPKISNALDKTAAHTAEYYLLDAATGTARQVKGEFRPLEEKRYRPLQMSSTAGGAWAAIYEHAAKATVVGLYIEKSFSFIPVATLPDIQLGSSDIWVHEKENKIYFVYRGHLLATPLRQP